MLKKIALALLLFVAITFASFGQQYAFQSTNGKDWRSFNEDQKVSLTLGFFMGVSFTNCAILGSDEDGIVYLEMQDYLEIISYVEKFYSKNENLMTSLVEVYIKAFMKILFGI